MSLKGNLYIKSSNIVRAYYCVAEVIAKNEKGNFILIHKNVEDFTHIVENILRSKGIEFGKNYRSSVVGENLFSLVISIINLSVFGLKQEYILDFLNCYPIGFENSEIWNFQNYCAIYDIEDFESDFFLLPVRKLKKSEKNLEALESLNKTRLKIVEFMSKVRENAKKIGYVNFFIEMIMENTYLEYENRNLFVKILNSIKEEFDEISPLELKEKLKKYAINYEIDSNSVDIFSDFNICPKKEDSSVFVILDNFDKLEDCKEFLCKFRNKYLIFLNDEYLKIEKNKIISDEEILNCETKISERDDDSFKLDISEWLGGEIDVSVSQIESYYRCSLLYFFNSVLDIHKLKKFSFDSSEYGSLIHWVLEKYLRFYFEKNIKPDVHEIVKEYIFPRFEGLYSESKINHMVDKYSNNLEFVAERIFKEFEESGFVPKEFEMQISRKIVVNNGFCVNLKGKIDRVDTNEDKHEIRIVDYKTGNKKFNLVNVFYGIDIQPIVYLNSFVEEKYKKSGAFYFCTRKPIINGENLDINSVNLEKKIDECVSFQGISLDGSTMQKDNSLCAEDFKTVMKYSDFLIKNMVNDIISGGIYDSPKGLFGKSSQCEYCDYKFICSNINAKYSRPEKCENFGKIIKNMIDKMEKYE